MAHNINGKVYTDHPLMDEIVYNCKLILDGIIVKNDILANSFETDETLQDAEYFFIAKEHRMTISICPFTADILMQEFGYSQELARACVWDHNNVPVEDREAIVKFTSNQLVEKYVEKNRYYRALCGLPEYGTTEYDIYLDYSYFPSNYHKEIDFSKPLHEMDDSIIAVLESTGKIKQILEEHPGSNYDYVRCLGDKRLDPYTVRKAGKWDILYLPPVEALVENRFKELYNLNKEVYLQRTYDEAYDFNSTYYDHSMILMVLCQTFTDMVVDVPEWYIRRDIFDIRSVQYFLESYGVKFFKEIPLKYQIRLVKNLNKLIKYKSTNRNCEDILEIFALKETEIYKYYLYKKRLTDVKGEYVESDDINKQFELEFVQCGLNDSYDDYIKDQVYRTPYDDITYQDKYWDGEDSHDYIKNLHMERDFTIEGTKYMSIEYKISMEKYLYQMQYFVSLLVDSRLDSSDVRVGIPSIQPGTTFKLSDLFLFLSVLSLEYENCGTFIRRPNKYKEVAPSYSEEYYDWMKKWFPEVFVKKRNRVYGFNPNADLGEVQEVIGRRHSKYNFEHGFTLEELGVQHFEAPKKVDSIDDLIRLYKNNTLCYDNLRKIREEAVDNRDESLVMEYVFDSLFTKEFDYKYYELDSDGTEAQNLEEILQNNDYVLYNLYLKITTEPNDEAKRDNIRAVLNDVVNTLEYYLSGDGLEYIFSFTAVASFNSLINYIYLIMNFFKSYKVYFLEPYVTYQMNDKIENFAGGMDVIAEKNITYWKHDRHFLADAAVYNVFKYLEDQAGTNRVVEVLDIHGHFEGDPDDDYDYDGMYASSTGSGYKMADGGYADPFSCVPFVVLNGGSAQGSRMDLWDLNGATATELRDYVDIDAGYAYNPDDYVSRDYFATAFNYMIDGGGAATNHFFTNSMHVKVIDRQIEAQVRVSTAQYNNIIETEDGLYMQQQWSSWTDFEELETQTSNTYEYFSSMYNDLSDTIKISSDIAILEDRIEKCIGYYVDGLRKVYDYMDTGTFEENLTNYTDERVAELYSEFYGFSPFSWEEF